MDIIVRKPTETEIAEYKKNLHGVAESLNLIGIIIARKLVSLQKEKSQ